MTKNPLSSQIADEMSIYDEAPVDLITSELQAWDSTLYPATVRKYEYSLLLGVIHELSPRVVLDLGCGPGWLTHFLSSHTELAIGVDVARSLLMNATRTSKQNENFVSADGCRLPLLSGSIDLVVSVGAFHHLPPKRALDELRRVLGPAGAVALFEPNQWNPIARIGRRVFPTEIHTAGERPFSPTVLRNLLVSEGWDILHWETRFLFVFAISRVLRIIGDNLRFSKQFTLMLHRFEEGFAASGLTGQHGWIISCIARPNAGVRRSSGEPLL